MAIVSLDAQEAVNGDESFGLAESSVAPKANVRQIALYPPASRIDDGSAAYSNNPRWPPPDALLRLLLNEIS